MQGVARGNMGGSATVPSPPPHPIPPMPRHGPTQWRERSRCLLLLDRRELLLPDVNGFLEVDMRHQRIAHGLEHTSNLIVAAGHFIVLRAA